jgi:DNA-binding transcriptional MerR regulator
MRIGQLAAATGLTTKTLRYYEQRGLLEPASRTNSGYRDYDHTAIARLEFLHRGQGAGLTLSQLGQILTVRDSGHPPCGHVADLLADQISAIDTQIRQLTQLCGTLTQLHDQARAADPDTCPPEQICQYL